MSDAIISVVLTQLGSILEQQIRQQLTLVMGVDQEIGNLTGTFRAIKAVLLDAEKRQVKEETVKVWLQKLRDVAYDMDDVLAEWSTAILKIQIEGAENTTPKKKVVSFITCPCFCFNKIVFRRDIALKIKDVHERLNVIATEKDRYNFRLITSSEGQGPERLKTTSHVDVSEVRGRDGDKNTLIKELLRERTSSSELDRNLDIVSIIGMGGIGKTTLAQLAYNCDEVTRHFKIRTWVCVSDPFDEVRVGKAILEVVQGSAPNVFELETVLSKLRDSIAGEKFLLVLDDVWTEDCRKWEPLINSLKSGAPGSKVLVTTRNERIGILMRSSYMLRLGELSEQDCWSLFSQIAFCERSNQDSKELEETGKKIANKCKGLPLAAKTIGSLMRFKTSLQDWQNVLDNDLWGLEGPDTSLFPPLLLSYYDLPSVLKPCFSFCAYFPKDYKIESNNLIKLWMAHGYLGNVEMEAIGQQYLDNLAMRCFFQNLEKDKDSDKIVQFKMHDMVHDFAQYLMRNECFLMEMDTEVENKINSSCSKARHLTLVRAEEVLFPLSIGNADKLHSFWVQSYYDCPPLVNEVDNISSEFFNLLFHLKALDLSRNRLRELPKDIRKLINLRYLNLSHNPLWELPETVCELYNLQTLKLVACHHLWRLPKGIERLINLRHLENDPTDGLKKLPRGIGRLCSLQTLNKFVIGNSRDAEETMCKLEDLKDLNQLRGSLKIEGLGHVASMEEAEKAELKNKRHLNDVHMDFNPTLASEGREEVIEALELHPQLQCLQISSYRGFQFPSWMTSLTNLRKLRLEDCQNCIHLPPLGRLPSLETLSMENMHELKHIGCELLGSESSSSADTTQVNGSSAATDIFPKLKKLKFSNMRNWEEWDIRSVEQKVGNLRVLPCLRFLKLSNCPKLKALPDVLLQMAPMRKLRIHNCPPLKQKYRKGTGELWIKIAHIPKVRVT